MVEGKSRRHKNFMKYLLDDIRYEGGEVETGIGPLHGGWKQSAENHQDRKQPWVETLTNHLMRTLRRGFFVVQTKNSCTSSSSLPVDNDEFQVSERIRKQCKYGSMQ
ncbi:hypothetical protein MAR_009808 [Mya arenaria]|uniref:Uncharacterized protein n=1 Tax=Mya arenaria TaxID=6604 RepID=A0ABY7E2S8_MYAAR|nr:hypothetical protein MAR_009808 [Mya arenaria]